MKRIEAFFTLQLNKERKEEVHIAISALHAVQDVMLIGALPNVELQFCYDSNAMSLNSIISLLQSAGIAITRKILHLPAEISGISSIYDARDFGGRLKSAIEEIDGVKQAGISETGSIKLELSADCVNPEATVKSIIISVKTIRKNLN